MLNLTHFLTNGYWVLLVCFQDGGKIGKARFYPKFNFLSANKRFSCVSKYYNSTLLVDWFVVTFNPRNDFNFQSRLSFTKGDNEMTSIAF